jgi:hypothetical protein
MLHLFHLGPRHVLFPLWRLCTVLQRLASSPHGKNSLTSLRSQLTHTALEEAFFTIHVRPWLLFFPPLIVMGNDFARVFANALYPSFHEDASSGQWNTSYTNVLSAPSAACHPARPQQILIKWIKSSLLVEIFKIPRAKKVYYYLLFCLYIGLKVFLKS